MVQVIRNEYVTNIPVRVLGGLGPDRVQVSGLFRHGDALIVGSIGPAGPRHAGPVPRGRRRSRDRGHAPDPSQGGIEAAITPPGTRMPAAGSRRSAPRPPARTPAAQAQARRLPAVLIPSRPAPDDDRLALATKRGNTRSDDANLLTRTSGPPASGRGWLLRLVAGRRDASARRSSRKSRCRDLPSRPGRSAGLSDVPGDLDGQLSSPFSGLIFVFMLGSAVIAVAIGAGQPGGGGLLRDCSGFSSTSSISSAIRLAAQWEKAVVFRLGKYHTIEGPGPVHGRPADRPDPDRSTPASWR